MRRPSGDHASPFASASQPSAALPVSSPWSPEPSVVTRTLPSGSNVAVAFMRAPIRSPADVHVAASGWYSTAEVSKPCSGSLNPPATRTDPSERTTDDDCARGAGIAAVALHVFA